jgi:hypothetical protein
MVKMIRIFKRTQQFKEWLNSLDIHIGVVRMLKVLSFTVFLIHLMGCFWFLAASLEDNMYYTWVGERGLIDSSMGY